MGRFTRIPADTFEQLQTDAGILLYNFDPDNPEDVKDEDIICPTTGGITAAATPSYSDMGEDVDNCPANLIELKHLDSWDCHLDFTSLGTSPKSIRLALGAADIDSEKPSKIVPRTALKVTDAGDVWWVGDRADGGLVAVCLKRALSTSGFSLQTTKAGKGQTSCTLTGHTSVATQNEVPIEFYSMGMGKLTVKSEEHAENVGHTAITITEGKENEGDKYRYKVGKVAESVSYLQDLTNWGTEIDTDGLNDITAETGSIISIAEVNDKKKAVAFGYATVKAKAGE